MICFAKQLHAFIKVLQGVISITLFTLSTENKKNPSITDLNKDSRYFSVS